VVAADPFHHEAAPEVQLPDPSTTPEPEIVQVTLAPRAGETGSHPRNRNRRKQKKWIQA
jgi:hypothetical protein